MRPGLLHVRRSGSRALGQTARDVGEADPGDDRDTVPPAVAVQGDLVAERFDLRRGNAVIGDLGLLQAHDVGRGVLEPVEQSRQPGGDGVDVPGSDAHEHIITPATDR